MQKKLDELKVPEDPPECYKGMLAFILTLNKTYYQNANVEDRNHIELLQPL